MTFLIRGSCVSAAFLIGLSFLIVPAQASKRVRPDTNDGNSSQRVKEDAVSPLLERLMKNTYVSPYEASKIALNDLQSYKENCQEKDLDFFLQLLLTANKLEAFPDLMLKIVDRGKSDQASPTAQCNLGVYYEKGIGGQTDFSQAFKLYESAVQKGSTRAQRNLGICYEHARGIGKDLVKAVEWYKSAADQGYTEAQYNLAQCYESAVGTEKNDQLMLHYYTLSANQGHAAAQGALGVIYQQGESILADYPKALEFYQKAAKQEDPRALYALGACYEIGLLEIPQDNTQAFNYYKRCAEQGDERGYIKTAGFYLRGVPGVSEKNLLKAVGYSHKAQQPLFFDILPTIDRKKSLDDSLKDLKEQLTPLNAIKENAKNRVSIRDKMAEKKDSFSSVEPHYNIVARFAQDFSSLIELARKWPAASAGCCVNCVVLQKELLQGVLANPQQEKDGFCMLGINNNTFYFIGKENAASGSFAKQVLNETENAKSSLVQIIKYIQDDLRAVDDQLFTTSQMPVLKKEIEKEIQEVKKVKSFLSLALKASFSDCMERIAEVQNQKMRTAYASTLESQSFLENL